MLFDTKAVFLTLIFIGSFFLYRIIRILSFPRVIPRRTRANLMILLGSGGHTGEMLRLLVNVDINRFHNRIWVHGSDDAISSQKAASYEESYASDSAKGHVIISVPRARTVGQSWLSTIWTSAISLFHCFFIVLHYKPHVVVTNGPGTSVMLCYSVWVLRILGLSDCSIVYIESLARVSTLSVSGKFLLPISDEFIVQWPELAEKYPKAKYWGRLI